MPGGSGELGAHIAPVHGGLASAVSSAARQCPVQGGEADQLQAGGAGASCHPRGTQGQHLGGLVREEAGGSGGSPPARLP